MHLRLNRSGFKIETQRINVWTSTISRSRPVKTALHFPFEETPER